MSQSPVTTLDVVVAFFMSVVLTVLLAKICFSENDRLEARIKALETQLTAPK